MANLAADAIWTAIAERVTGVNTIGTRPMPATGVTHIKCDRVVGATDSQQAFRALFYANASIAVEYDRYEGGPPQPSNVLLYTARVRIGVTYNLTSQAALGETYQIIKSLAQRHADMLTQALWYPNALLVTQAAGKAYDGTTLASGTATGIVSGCLFPDGGMVIVRDDGNESDVYETEHRFRGTVQVTGA